MGRGTRKIEKHWLKVFILFRYRGLCVDAVTGLSTSARRERNISTITFQKFLNGRNLMSGMKGKLRFKAGFQISVSFDVC